MNPYYIDYAEYLRRIFGPGKVQKISVDAGCSCPNRDGTIGRGGCIYCDNTTFTPAYCASARGDIAAQLESGKRFFSRKYPQMRYLAYFQSFTFTHAASADTVAAMMRTAADTPGIAGIVIGTRPDSLPDSTLDAIAAFNTPSFPVILELGAESMHARTLALVNRGHTPQQTADAIRRAADRGLRCGVHLIAGLPGESPDEALDSLRAICRLPVDSVKLHQLQIVKGTPLHRLRLAGQLSIEPFTAEAYLDFCVEAVGIVRSAARPIAIERFVAQAPPAMVVAPSWGLKNYQFTNLLMHRLENRFGAETQ